MNWLTDYRRDIMRYVELGGGPAWKHILAEQGLWALLQHRLEAATIQGALPAPIKLPLRLGLLVWHKLIEMATGICLPSTARIGPGLHLPHGGLRVVHGQAAIGSDCCICQGVTIGVSGRGEHRGVPVIGDRVYIGVNAVVVGKITVGSDSVIGANSLVNRDVPPHCTVIGVPATVVSQKGSEEYLSIRSAARELIKPTAAPALLRANSHPSA